MELTIHFILSFSKKKKGRVQGSCPARSCPGRVKVSCPDHVQVVSRGRVQVVSNSCPGVVSRGRVQGSCPGSCPGVMSRSCPGLVQVVSISCPGRPSRVQVVSRCHVQVSCPGRVPGRVQVMGTAKLHWTPGRDLLRTPCKMTGGMRLGTWTTGSCGEHVSGEHWLPVVKELGLPSQPATHPATD